MQKFLEGLHAVHNATFFIEVVDTFAFLGLSLSRLILSTLKNMVWLSKTPEERPTTMAPT